MGRVNACLSRTAHSTSERAVVARSRTGPVSMSTGAVMSTGSGRRRRRSPTGTSCFHFGWTGYAYNGGCAWRVRSRSGGQTCMSTRVRVRVQAQLAAVRARCK